MSISPSKDPPILTKHKLDKKFQPCPVERGDEVFRNGIFPFNITRLLAFARSGLPRSPYGKHELGRQIPIRSPTRRTSTVSGRS